LTVSESFDRFTYNNSVSKSKKGGGDSDQQEQAELTFLGKQLKQFLLNFELFMEIITHNETAY
jgi:hypothetical protein